MKSFIDQHKEADEGGSLQDQHRGFNSGDSISKDRFIYNVFLSLGFYLRTVLPPSVIEDIYETLLLIEGGANPAAGFSEGISSLVPPPLTKNYRRKPV